jgi:Ca-activated chloride channel family protein
MSSIKAFQTSLSALALLAVAMPTPGYAQDEMQDEEDSLSEVMVTGARIRQGGAQDIQHFRSTALSATTLPRPESLTVEGLLGEHDLTLPAGVVPCAQLFCLNIQAMAANLPTRPDDLLFVGMAFDSNIDADSWKREPLSIMAVVDRSGSMTGPPIANVKAALHQMVDELGPKDRLGIVIYGTNSNLHLPATGVGGNQAAMHQAIDAIAIDGSTSMEAGLTLGYEAAFAEAAKSGKVRMMLFTDEQPNVGRTDAGSFMAMAEEGSQRGVGLTTIGVGTQYDGALATEISSVRGGNLFFVDGPDKGRDLMRKEFRNMVSEVAHDLVMTLIPHAGYRISGVFGVPDGLMTEGKDGAVAITIPTAFLSSNGGGIYASLGKGEERAHLPAATLADGAPLMDVSLSYVSALDGSKHGDALSIGSPTVQPATNLRLAQTLVDQYWRWMPRRAPSTAKVTPKRLLHCSTG